MKLTLEAVPSPRNTNHERLFMCKLPRGVDPERAQLALDAAISRRADDRHDRRHDDDYDRRHADDDRRVGHDEEERDLYELRRKLEHHLAQCLSVLPKRWVAGVSPKIGRISIVRRSLFSASLQSGSC
jgi:hypothetical protein